MTAKPTCLTQAIIAHLREVGAPQRTQDIRAALLAKGLRNAGDVNKRVFALGKKGTLKKTHDGDHAWYEVIESPATEKLSKTVRPASPKPVYGGFRAAVIAVITAKPGLKASEIREELEELGYVVKKSEPSGALDALCRQERLRKEGVHPYRRYFINDASVYEKEMKVVVDKTVNRAVQALTNKLTATIKNNPLLPAKALAAVAANATSAGATEHGPATSAKEAIGQARAPRTEGSAVTAGKDRQPSDDPIDNLANAIEQHLDLSEFWHSLTLISKDLKESALDVSAAVRRLVESKRIKMYTDPSSRFRQFASLSVAGNSPHESPDETLTEPAVKESLTAEPIESPSQPNPTRPTPDDVKAGTTDTAAGGEECAPLEEPAAVPVSFTVNVNGGSEKTDWHRVVRDVLPPALQAAMLGDAGVWSGPSLDVSDDRLRAEITAELSSLLSTAELVSEATALRVDIEDLVGRACDEQADHRAIKALTTAAFAFTRALAHLGARA